MQTKLTTFLILLIGMILAPLASQGQACTPDPNAPSSGIFPDTLATACPGVPYSFTITLGVPQDTSIAIFPPPAPPFVVMIDSIVINNITDLPPGITYACGPASCTFVGGTKGCITFTGTPTTSGTFLLDLDVTLYGGGVSLPAILTDTLPFTVGYGGTPVSTDATCGGTDGSATIDALTGMAPYTFLWSDGQTDSVATNLAAGAYTVAVTDASGCTVSLSVSVNSSGGTAPVIDATQTAIGWDGCHDVDGGFVQPNISGGTAPLSYIWSNGDTTASLTGLPANSYSLTVTGADGCSSGETFMVAAPQPMTLALNNKEDVSCFGESDGTASVRRQGGQGPTFSFTWAPTGQTGAAVANLAPGTYTATVEDAIGCIRTTDIIIAEPDQLTIDASATAATDASTNDGTASALAEGGTGAYTYAWDNGETGEELTGLAAGTYIVTVTDINGCAAMDTVEVLLATAIDLPLGVESVRVYPNPSQGVFSLDLTLAQPEALAVNAFDLQGRLVGRWTAAAATQHSQRIDLRKVPQGTYLLEVQVGDHRLHRRVLID
jgi:hypothetical protein